MTKLQHGCWRATAMAAVLAALSPAAARAAEIRVWPTAVVSGQDVFLKDLAELRDFDTAEQDRLSDIVVYPAPRAGGHLVIRTDDVRAALQDGGANLADVQIMGAAACRVSKPAPVRKPPHSTASKAPPIILAPRPKRQRVVSSEGRAKPAESVRETRSSNTSTLESQLRDFIAARSGFTEGRVEVRFSAAGAEALSLTSPPHTFEIKPRTTRKIGLLSFDVEVLTDGALARIVPIVAEANLVREVVIARRAINRGETIEARSVRLEERRFSEESAIGLNDPVDVIGRQSRGFLRPGDMLAASGVQEKPVVTRGQSVTIWMRQGGMTIRAGGKAQQSGTLGDRIEVLRDGTMRKSDLLEAVVTGPGTVSVAPAQLAALAGN